MKDYVVYQLYHLFLFCLAATIAGFVSYLLPKEFSLLSFLIAVIKTFGFYNIFINVRYLIFIFKW